MRLHVAITALALLFSTGCEIEIGTSSGPQQKCPGPCPGGVCFPACSNCGRKHNPRIPCLIPLPVKANGEQYVGLQLSEIPEEIRQKNYGGGSCLYAGLITPLEHMGEKELANRIRKYKGGQHVDGLSRICEAEGIRFVATSDGDENLLEWCSRTRRMATIHYFPVHAVTFCGYENGEAVLIDNNKVRADIRIPKDRFIRDWHGYGGCALIPIYSPAPPPAHRS